MSDYTDVNKILKDMYQSRDYYYEMKKKVQDTQDQIQWYIDTEKIDDPVYLQLTEDIVTYNKQLAIAKIDFVASMSRYSPKF